MRYILGIVECIELSVYLVHNSLHRMCEQKPWHGPVGFCFFNLNLVTLTWLQPHHAKQSPCGWAIRRLKLPLPPSGGRVFS